MMKLALPILLLVAVAAAQECCIDSPQKPLSPPEVADYDCSQLVPFGPDRCKAVYGGNVCQWATGDACTKPEPTCARVSKFEVHYGKRYDVGECRGTCKDSKEQRCKPKGVSPMAVLGGVVMIVKECECASCAAVPDSTAVEVPTGYCAGKCATPQESRTCSAGRADNFDTSDGAEPSSPSAALLSGPLTACSAGIQSGFDIFADNKCFGHTFSECIVRGPCPLKSATLKVCLEAAQVSLTYTDSIAIGAGGSLLWGISLPALSGVNSWGPGQQVCVALDLGNLPNTGANILPSIFASGDVDFFVQDDSAVDFLELEVEYEQCQVCLPRHSVISTLYTARGAQNFVDVKDCGCFETSKCRRESNFQTFFPNTIFETTVDVGQCVGSCGSQSRCRASTSTKRELKAPEGIRTIGVISACSCSPIVVPI